MIVELTFLVYLLVHGFSDIGVFCQNELKIGFIYDTKQALHKHQFSETLENFQQKNLLVMATYILVDDENLNVTSENFCKILETEGLSLIIDITNLQWDDGIEIIQSLSIPHIRIDVSVKPFHRVMEAFLKARSALDAAFIYENLEQYYDGIYYLVEESELRLIGYPNLNWSSVQRIKKLRPTPAYFGMFGHTEAMNKMFKKAYEQKLITRPDKWTLLFLDYNYAKFSSSEIIFGTNITKIVPDIELSCKMFGMDEQCLMPNPFNFGKLVISEILEKVLNIRTWSTRKYQCNPSEDVISNVLQGLENQNLLISQLKLSSFLKISKNSVTYDVPMKIFQESDNKDAENPIGAWTNGNLTTIDDIGPARRFYRIGTTEVIPWSYYLTDPETHQTILDANGEPIWEGYCIDFIRKLSEKIDFDYEIVRPKKGTFGKRYSNGSFDGLIGDLITGEIDMAVAALIITAEREEVIDFVTPYFEQSGISIVIRKPIRLTSIFKFMTVLRGEVWLSILAALVATAILIWILDTYSPYSSRNNKDAYPYPCREFTLQESFWFALTSFTPQGGGEPPKSLSGRILVGVYWLFVVLMLATFTANLAAFLTVERMQTPIQSLEQLARQSRINYSVVEGSQTHQYFINMKFAEDTLYRLWKELVLNATSDQSQYRIWDYPIKEQYGQILMALNGSNLVKNPAEGFRLVTEHLNADFAFIHDSQEIKYEMTRNCYLSEVGDVFAEHPYSIAVQQGSHLHDDISYAVLELQKDRFFEQLTEKYWNSSAKRICDDSDDNDSITLGSLAGVFIGALIGLLLAITTMVVEVISYKRKTISVQTVKPLGEADPPKVLNRMKIRKPFSIAGNSPPPSFENAIATSKSTNDENINAQRKIIPVSSRLQNISYYNIRTRNPIHSHSQLYYYE